MVEEYVFQPERRLGYIIHLATMLLLAALGLFGLYQASLTDIGPVFLLYLLPMLAAVIIIPALAYRFYALRNGLYVLEREGMHLRWGLRIEDIPIDNILWVRRAGEINRPVPRPRFHWPGAVLGVRRLPGSGEIEYMAADVSKLVLVATGERVYGLSPSNPDTFILAFERCIEMGSLAPIESRSLHPAFLLARVWREQPARLLILMGAGLSMALLAWVGAIIPVRGEVRFGLRPGISGDVVSSVRLLLLPVINTGFFLLNFFVGLFFFRKEESRPYAYLLWAGAALTPLLFLAAVAFILWTG